MVDTHSEEVNRLMAEISALLEDAHEFAIAGQATHLSHKEIMALAVSMKGHLQPIGDLADKTLVQTSAGQ